MTGIEQPTKEYKSVLFKQDSRERHQVKRERAGLIKAGFLEKVGFEAGLDEENSHLQRRKRMNSREGKRYV